MRSDGNALKDSAGITAWRSPRRALLAFFIVGSLSSAGTSVYQFMTLGISGGLAALVFALMFVPALLFIGFALLAALNRDLGERIWGWLFTHPQRARTVLRLAGILFILSALQYAIFAGYYPRLFPLFINAVVITGAAFGIALVQVKGIRRIALADYLGAQKRALYIALAIFVAALGLWLVIALTDRGIHSTEDYWFGAGTPLLFQQLVIGILLAGLLSAYEDRLVQWVGRVTKFRLSPDAAFFLLFWLVAALVWAAQSTPSGFVAPRPMPPNFEHYPFADARRFDVGSQFALIGQGLNDGHFYYRVFYMGYLFILHALFGQGYDKLMFVQAILFAVFPAVIYLLGKTLWNRRFAFAAASIILFTGANSMPASEMVDLANPKQMATDFPTAIGIAIVLLFTIQWMRQPRRLSSLFWAAGALGISALVRTSTLGLLPLLLALIWVLRPRPSKGRLILSGFVVILFLASAIPWSVWYGRFVTDMYSTKILSVLHVRYLQPKTSPPLDQPEQETVIDGAEVSRLSPVQAVTDHFLHGMAASTLTLPASPLFLNLPTVIREAFPYWDPQWDGSLDVGSELFIALNLALLAFGVASAFRSSGVAGGLPLVTFFLYTTINSVGRTSGGRYSAPVDWIFLFYYVWGVLAVLQWLRVAFSSPLELEERAQVDVPKDHPVTFKEMFRKAYPVFLVLFGVSALMIFSSTLMPKRYAPRTQDKLLEILVQTSSNKSLPGFSEADLREFLQQEDAGLWMGRALYPRYFLAAQGLSGIAGVYHERDYPRLMFSLIGPDVNQTVMLPGAPPQFFPNAADVIVLGCQADKMSIEALMVVVLEGDSFLYTVPASVALDCPLQAKE